MKNYHAYKKELLKNKDLRSSYKALKREFALIETLIDKRLENNLSQKELAKKIGTKQSAISRLESGGINPSLAFLEKVAKGLGTNLCISFQ